MYNSLQQWFRTGQPWIWLNAGAVTISLLLVIGLMGILLVRGLGHFWPAPLQLVTYTDPQGEELQLLGIRVERQQVTADQIRNAGLPVPPGVDLLQRQLIKVGNRDLYGLDFRWVLEYQLSNLHHPRHAVVIQRSEWGNFHGFIRGIQEGGLLIAEQQPDENRLWDEVQLRLQRVQLLQRKMRQLEQRDISAINHQLERLRLAERRMALRGQTDATRLAALQLERRNLQAEYQRLEQQLLAIHQPLARDSLLVQTADGQQLLLPFRNLVSIHQPNNLSLLQKIRLYLLNLWAFVSEGPREANTEGGIFPALFGTVMMVLIMSVMVAPMGVVAAIYLHEYARQNWLTRSIRIAVNNLAGVPSIVYGVFGLGFFVYFVGGGLDRIFFPEALPAPTFGTPGLLWASLTLALLTLPVVIVATEEGLSRIPRSVREGSLALGATQAETLWRVVLPMASPAMMTGVILAVARAAGEVAPLMLVGVVKLAPSLPVDLNAPYVHLERKFMHLGFHIYDVGFQSPNIEAARPLVYATALLLVLVILVLNLTAIALRNHLREKYRALDM
ncbi:phosphate ABC transporter permease PstA [Marinospirillum alkaliphilum]|uniref:Phosphate transport system permease protein PstA n=1 Tax=Marinospirillum alkaliphilum DSM 21637 TaxID=1122209 RepID=A0A1K1WK30_9GAMM|nr:phosphate ABC transporter permease PstA [Marinospirillum alkaliphilum]SFX37491.1 phosphate transport system permease protein [Marinospirillum alkaliphilum DSM 21637]